MRFTMILSEELILAVNWEMYGNNIIDMIILGHNRCVNAFTVTVVVENASCFSTTEIHEREKDLRTVNNVVQLRP